MGIRGPKPQPAVIKKLRGNPGKRPIKKDIALSADYPNDVPEPPEHLTEIGKKEWMRVAPILHRLKLLSNLDVVALEAYCQKFCEWREAQAQLQKYGMIIKSPNGYPIQSPYLSIARGALAEMSRLMAEFGMTPSARMRFHVLGKEEEEEEEKQIEDFIRSGKKLRAVK